MRKNSKPRSFMFQMGGSKDLRLYVMFPAKVLLEKKKQKRLKFWETHFMVGNAPAYNFKTVFEVPYLKLQTLHEDQPNDIVLLVGLNDTNKQASGKSNMETIAENIVNIFKCCITCGEKKMKILLILPKRNIGLARLIRQVNGMLKE